MKSKIFLLNEKTLFNLFHLNFLNFRSFTFFPFDKKWNISGSINWLPRDLTLKLALFKNKRFTDTDMVRDVIN